MKIDETTTIESINNHYGELVSALFVLVGRRPDLKDEIAEEIKCIIKEKYEVIENFRRQMTKK